MGAVDAVGIVIGPPTHITLPWCPQVCDVFVYDAQGFVHHGIVRCDLTGGARWLLARRDSQVALGAARAAGSLGNRIGRVSL